MPVYQAIENKSKNIYFCSAKSYASKKCDKKSKKNRLDLLKYRVMI